MSILRILKVTYILLLALISSKALGQNNLLSNTSDCSGTRPEFSFNIQSAWTSNTGNRVNTIATPVSGDLDGDGFAEIVVSNRSNDSIFIFEGRDGSLITKLSGGVTNAIGSSSMLLCNIDGKGAVFYIDRSYNGFLYKVRSSAGVRPIEFDLVWNVSGLNPGGSYENRPIVADLDGDGILEFVVGSKIVDSQDGSILATMAYSGIGSFPSSYPIAVELDNDGLPEVAVGTNIYKFNRASSPKLTLWKSLANVTGGGTAREGNNIAADIDQDGIVDIVFHSASGIELIVWTPQTETIIGTITGLKSGQRSYPFVGDIDGTIINGEKYPEIIINATHLLTAYYFDGSSFQTKWTMTHSDGSGGTTLTLFDFDNNGTVELVYRDENFIQIFDGSGTSPKEVYSETCGSITATETPIIADVTGDGSANIIVTGNPQGSYIYDGELMVFEGAASKWSSCPNVWNQQLYSSLHVNGDLTIPRIINPFSLSYTQTCTANTGNVVQCYNGCPIQAPYISKDTYCPIDLAPDVLVLDGTLEILSSTSVKITVIVGNQGMATASASMPVQYYKHEIGASNIIGTETLGVDLYPGQTTIITKIFTGLEANISKFYVRILDDGISFPASGAYSDCNLTNNTKSFGTLELLKTVNSMSSCIDGTNIFYVNLINNTDQSIIQQTFNNVILIDSLGTGWEFILAEISYGTLGEYNSTTRGMQWTVPVIAPGDTVRLLVVAKATEAGSIRNTVWIQEIDGTTLGKEDIEAYVQVDSHNAPAATTISPAGPILCDPDEVLLTADVDAVSYQWYLNNVEIPGATNKTYTATETGNYVVAYFDGTCVSQLSTHVTVDINECVAPTSMLAVDDYIITFANTGVEFNVLTNDQAECESTFGFNIDINPTNGTIILQNDGTVTYTPNTGFIGSDKFTYTISCGTTTSTTNVYITVLIIPEIQIEGECSIQPKLKLTHSYTNITCKWEYSADGTVWQTLVEGTDVEINISEAGFYRATITYENITVQLQKGIKTTINRRITLPGGIYWYDMSYFIENINW
ncbi:MAG: cadherin-like domain-containing protein [Prevotellaceae bacterium]|jgi:hypothetical protein|nr:cadherin-like domain-containing protein [Prevotellaceae bacterium]